MYGTPAAQERRQMLIRCIASQLLPGYRTSCLLSIEYGTRHWSFRRYGYVPLPQFCALANLVTSPASPHVQLPGLPALPSWPQTSNNCLRTGHWLPYTRHTSVTGPAESTAITAQTRTTFALKRDPWLSATGTSSRYTRSGKEVSLLILPI